ncbi:MAG: IS200/IS605 family transposase [Acidobacteria bacterium]|nr:IS200/IS605 family transposase [Acidobacteriota bacterium]
MSHTHFLYHIVFGTKDRQPLIRPEWERELYAYMSGIITNLRGHSLEINGVADHLHLLVRLDAHIAFSGVMRELKASSSRWIRKNHDAKFLWQRRYGAFTVSESASDSVRRYIRTQKEHHKKQLFEDEYKSLLVKHRVTFDEKYLWA